MKAVLNVLLIAITLFATDAGSSITESYSIAPVDVVMIDTGLDKYFHGILNMKPEPCRFTQRCDHGLKMAESIKDQLERAEASPINAVQIAWADEQEIVADIYKAIRLNPKVLSMSLSGESSNRAEYQALKWASDFGILIVVAAGNEGKMHSDYPGSYELECLVSISTNRRDRKDDVANFGQAFIPKVFGENGTSYSTARAAAIAMKFYQNNPKATCKEAKTYLITRFGPHTIRWQ
jgi:hypothetical protein